MENSKMDKKRLMKELGYAQGEIYQTYSCDKHEELWDYEEQNAIKGVPKDKRVRINLSNDSIMKFRVIICPQFLSEENTKENDYPFWPLFVATKECDVYDFMNVMNKLFPSPKNENRDFFWDGTTDILTQHLQDSEEE